MTMQRSFGIAIPAYRNIAHLRRCLASIATAAPPLLARTVVVDDSGYGSNAQALRTEFPSVTWIEHAHNCGFGPSATEAVAACPADIAILLNDDVVLLTDPCKPLQEAFLDTRVFAVTFRSEHSDGRFREGAKRLVWPMGVPRILHNEQDQSPQTRNLRESAYAVGGHAAYDRRKVLALGGFDPRYEPFYWEDVDLCARARERGWSTLFCPDCVVMHDEGGAIRSSVEHCKILEITQRNRLLFAWRHIPKRLWPLHFLAVAVRVTSSLLTRDKIFLRAFRAARRRHRAGLHQ